MAAQVSVWMRKKEKTMSEGSGGIQISGKYLDNMGETRGVKRNDDEADDDYRQRIIDSLLIPKTICRESVEVTTENLENGKILEFCLNMSRFAESVSEGENSVLIHNFGGWVDCIPMGNFLVFCTDSSTVGYHIKSLSKDDFENLTKRQPYD